MSTRRIYFIDWLRVLAVLLLFPFHTSRVFNFGEPFYIKSAYLSQALNYFIGFVDLWHMPLLFMLAGASTYFSLSKRSGGQYAKERVTRLLVPFVFGVLVLIPPQTYVGAGFNSGYTGSYWTYITSGAFLRWNIQPAGDYYGGIGIGQLWFILFLLLISLIALPFVVWGRRGGERRVKSWARAIGRTPWWLLVPFVLLIAEAMPAVAGKNLIYDLAFFVLGYIAIADDAFTESAERYAWLALGVGSLVGGAWLLAGPLRDTLPDPSVPLAVMNYLGRLGVWAILFGLWGLGKRHLDRTTPALGYLAEASYPVYILHQTVIVVVAVFLVGLPGGWPVQWVAILVASVVATFALYEGVSRLGALRLLFGMKPRPHLAVAPVAEQPAAEPVESIESAE